MSNIVNEQRCVETLRLLDLYLDGQLETGANESVIQHLHDCPSCTQELEVRRYLRKRLKTAASGITASPYLETRILANVRSASRKEGWFGWKRQLVGAAAMLAVCLGTVIAYQLGHLRFTTEQQEKYIAAVSQRVIPIMRAALGDYIHCSVYRKYGKTPPSDETLASDLGPEYKGMLDIVKPHVPAGFQVVFAHKCKYHERQFVHITMKSDTRIATLLLARKEPGETFANSELKAVIASGQLPIYHAAAQRFEIAGFETRDHLAYVISDMSNQSNTELMLAIAPQLRQFLARLES